MQRYSALAMLLLLLSLVALVAVADPNGAYCGSYSFGLVTGKVNFEPSTSTFDLAFDGLGAHVKCAKEAYTFHPESGAIDVPGAADSSNCLGDVLNSNGLSLTATYDASADTVGLDLGLASLTASRC